MTLFFFFCYFSNNLCIHAQEVHALLIFLLKTSLENSKNQLELGSSKEELNFPLFHYCFRKLFGEILINSNTNIQIYCIFLDNR